MTSLAPSDPMTVYVKTMAGHMLSVEVDESMPPCDFPVRVHALLEEPRPPMAFLRFVMAKRSDEEEKETEPHDPMDCSNAHFFPMRFEDGDLFYLLVEDPEVRVEFCWQDDAILNGTGESMELIKMTLTDTLGMEIMQEAFYIVYVCEYEYRSQTNEEFILRRYTNALYAENQVLLSFDQADRIRELTLRDWRNVNVQRGAVPYSTPAFLAERYFRPEWHTYLAEQIQIAWRNYLLKTTGQEAPYPIHQE